MLKLLIAVDGSEPARRAIQAAGQLAREVVDLEVVLLHVRGLPAYHGVLPPFEDESIEQALREQQQTLLDAALTQARASGLEKVTLLAAVGSAPEEIARMSDEEQANQIVMGTRGRTPLGGLLLGSVAQRVIHLAHVPVLLVK